MANKWQKWPESPLALSTGADSESHLRKLRELREFIGRPTHAWSLPETGVARVAIQATSKIADGKAKELQIQAVGPCDRRHESASKSSAGNVAYHTAVAWASAPSRSRKLTCGNLRKLSGSGYLVHPAAETAEAR